ncbi:metallophosphoesterase family protein [Vagococcus lutrae]|uniref:metallophosphoesterase family protein n=1 Tax=Vagococcus lutrae TaxID=81947 RepID=UPI000F88F3ED|nr:metallophosphoesterase [Vagococcus lutrae]RST91618.1 serine/threonine protein phosphatase [Vagococcus lutrae]
MNILHISDIHYCQNDKMDSTRYKGMIYKMDNPLIHLEKCLKEAEKKRQIDLLLISGDLTEDGSVEDYVYLKKWFKEQVPDIKIIVTLGNHDIKENFYKGWLDKTPSNDPYNLVETFEDFYLISFDSSVYGLADGSMSDDQFNWLEKQLNTCKDKPVILMTHHHILKKQSSTPVLPESNRLINLIRGYSISSFVNGHTHHIFNGDIHGIPYFTVNGMSFVGEDEGDGWVRFEQKYGYNIYQIEHGVVKKQISENYFTGKTIARVDMKNNI